MQPKNRITAAMMAIFTGWFGGHKLYLGQLGGFIGFLFLLILSFNIGFPLSFIIGVSQGLKLMRMTDQEFNRKYNPGFVPVYQGPLEARRDAQMRRYEQVADRKPNPINRKASPMAAFKSNPYKNSGIKKYKDFDLEDAIVDFNKGLEISPNDVALHFNIACAYSLTENKAKSYQHISLAVANGLKDIERILSHDDLAFVRIQPEFQAFKQSGFKVNPFTQKTPKSDAEPTTTSSPEMDDTLLNQLNKLSELRNRGILTEDEFVLERKKILRQ